MPLRAVLFDLDGTLWHAAGPPDWNHITSLQAARVQSLLAPHVADSELEAFIADYWRGFVQADEPGARVPPISTLGYASASLQELDALALTRTFLQTHCPGLSADCTEAFWQAMLIPSHEFGLHLFEDTLATLAALKSRGLSLGLITNRFYFDFEADLARFEGTFDAVVTSGRVGFRKPHPSIFEAALRSLGVAPNEALMVGDSYEADILGGAAAGLHTVLKLNDREVLPEWRASNKVRSLSELVPLLDKFM
ncbi:MAG: HAD-IA family hydrolase [Dehalococcoidia bacterium]|nr:HAD-IA family hydrolase [Dehalococcoidia bacterium]